jgi:hypothetical protein
MTRRDFAMLAMFVGGYRQHQLAAIFGVSRARVRQVLLKAHRASGIPWRPQIADSGAWKRKYPGVRAAA